MINGYTPNQYGQQDEDKDQNSLANPLAASSNPQTSQPQQNQQQQNPPSVSSGQSATVGGGSGGSPSPAAPKAAGGQTQSSSGSYTNIQKYLGANQGQDLAGKINNNISNQVANVNGSVNNLANTYNQQAQSNNANATYNQGQGSQYYIDQANADPSKLADTDYTQFQNYLNASYAGPKSINDVTTANGQNASTVQNQIQNTRNEANQTATEAGRFNTLKQMFGNPNYTQGQQSLDNLMLQGNVKQFGDSRRAANSLNADYNNAAQQAQAQSQQYINNANTVKSNAATALGGQTQDDTGAWTGTGAIGNVISSVNSAVPAAQQAMADKYAQLQKDLASNHLSADQMKAAGVDSSQTLNGLLGGLTGVGKNQAFNEIMSGYGKPLDPNAVYTYGANLSNYVNPNNFDFNANNVATTQQAASYNALNKLAGNTAGGFITDPTQAGTAANYDVNSLLNPQLGKDIGTLSGQTQPLLQDMIDRQSWLDAGGQGSYKGGSFGSVGGMKSALQTEKDQLAALLGSSFGK